MSSFKMKLTVDNPNTGFETKIGEAIVHRDESPTPIKDLLSDGFVLLYDFKSKGGIVEVGDNVANIFERYIVKNDLEVSFYQNHSSAYGHDKTIFIKKSE